jgi:hypothetical protein
VLRYWIATASPQILAQQSLVVREEVSAYTRLQGVYDSGDLRCNHVECEVLSRRLAEGLHTAQMRGANFIKPLTSPGGEHK